MTVQKLQEKWAPVLNHDALPEIGDNYKKGVVAQLLENQEKAQIEEGQIPVSYTHLRAHETR